MMREKNLFKEIWEERPHYSEFSADFLGTEAKAHYFAHLLGKQAFPNFHLLKMNIVLLTQQEHTALDAGSDELSEKINEFFEPRILHLKMIYHKIQKDPIARLTFNYSKR